MNKLLILIDIDGTLLYPGLTPRRSLTAAIHQHTGKLIEFTVPMLAGMTDPLIVNNALDFLKIPSENRDGLPAKILGTYIQFLKEEYPQATDRGLFPGVKALLKFLYTLPVRLGLITGNMEQGARVKLQPYDLEKYFSMGVFSSDNSDRNKLPLIALTKCQKQFHESYSPDQVVIIGDTVRDVWCAHYNQMRAIAVVRHEERRSSIMTEKPDLIVDSFENLIPVRSYLKALLLN